MSDTIRGAPFEGQSTTDIKPVGSPALELHHFAAIERAANMLDAEVRRLANNADQYGAAYQFPEADAESLREVKAYLHAAKPPAAAPGAEPARCRYCGDVGGHMIDCVRPAAAPGAPAWPQAPDDATLGWAYSFFCSLADKGIDPRTIEAPKMRAQAIDDFAASPPAAPQAAQINEVDRSIGLLSGAPQAADREAALDELTAESQRLALTRALMRCDSFGRASAEFCASGSGTYVICFLAGVAWERKRKATKGRKK